MFQEGFFGGNPEVYFFVSLSSPRLFLFYPLFPPMFAVSPSSLNFVTFLTGSSYPFPRGAFGIVVQRVLHCCLTFLADRLVLFDPFFFFPFEFLGTTYLRLSVGSPPSRVFFWCWRFVARFVFISNGPQSLIPLQCLRPIHPPKFIIRETTPPLLIKGILSPLGHELSTRIFFVLIQSSLLPYSCFLPPFLFSWSSFPPLRLAVPPDTHPDRSRFTESFPPFFFQVFSEISALFFHKDFSGLPFPFPLFGTNLTSPPRSSRFGA